MSLSEQQYRYLQEMGITTWQQKHSDNDLDSNLLHELDERIIKHQLVLDVAQLFSLTQAELSFTRHHINLEHVNWIFADVDHCKLEKQRLITPDISILVNSSHLKKQLWTLLSPLVN